MVWCSFCFVCPSDASLPPTPPSHLLAPHRSQVVGSNGHAMASAEVERTFRGHFRYNSLSVSLLDSNKRIILDGDESRVVFQNVIRLR